MTDSKEAFQLGAICAPLLLAVRMRWIGFCRR